jgi:hypothetical protein
LLLTVRVPALDLAVTRQTSERPASARTTWCFAPMVTRWPLRYQAKLTDRAFAVNRGRAQVRVASTRALPVTLGRVRATGSARLRLAASDGSVRSAETTHDRYAATLV